MFAALAVARVNMKMITTGDIKISVLADRSDGVRALRAVHQAFGLDKARPGAGLSPKTNGAGGQGPYRRRPAVVAGAGRDLAALTQRLAGMEDILVTDVLLATDQGRITLFDLPDVPGNCSAVFQAVAAEGIIVDMIVQNLTRGKAELTFSVPLADLERATHTAQRLAAQIGGTRVQADADIARLIVLGVGMRTHTGVARRMFGALASRGINISMINTSEVRLTVVVDRPRGEEALACLKEAFNVA
jgi:aspartate kinase